MTAPDFFSSKHLKIVEIPVFILIFIFVFYPIASANSENNASILTELKGPLIGSDPNSSPSFQDNGAEIERSILSREQKLLQNLFMINDITSKKISPTGFIIKPSTETVNLEKIQDFTHDENNTLSEGSYIIHGSDGITRIFFENGTESSFAVDAEAAIIPNPFGGTIPSTYSISVPSGSTVERIGKNTHVIFNNRILLTISNNTIDMSTFLGHATSMDANIPATKSGSWIEWVKNSSPYYVVETDATWTTPHSPDLYSHLYVNGAGDSVHPVNFIFNGIQNRDGVGTSILQPVAGFDNTAFWIDNVSWQDHWYGAAYIVGPGPDNIHSTPIPLNEGDSVMGMISYDPAQVWTVYLFNQGSATQQNSLLFYRDRNFEMNPNNVDLYLTYEGWLCYNNRTTCTPDANTLKNDDVRFYNINVNAKIDGVLTPVTPIWYPDSDPDTFDHPMLTGIYVDLSQVPDRVNLETHRTSFTIIPSVSGTGGYINPVTEQTILWGADSEPFIIRAYQHNIIDEVYVISPGGIIESIGPKSTYTFRNVQSDYQIVAVFKESELTPISNFVNSISGNTVSLTDTSSNSPQEWSWDFGDPASGILNTATVQNPSHIYRYGGEYTVTLISSNANGAGTTKRYNISVDGPPPPVADFSASSTHGPAAPLAVQFNDTSNGFPTSWSWNFGDGSSSTEQNPSHTYLANGTYSVSLTATNAESGSNTTVKTNYITVGPIYATTNGVYTVLKFNETGSTRWTPPAGVTAVDYLVVGGGGSGSPLK